MKHRLTVVGIKNAADGKLYDGAGLILIKDGSGGKWVYRYSHLGRRRDMGLGPYPTLSLAQARSIRDEWANVLAQGGDPIDERNRRQEEEVAARSKLDPTFKEAVDLTFEARKDGLRGDGKRGRWMSPLTLYVIPKIGNKKVSAISQEDIRRAIAPIWRKKHPTAQKAIQRTRIVFEYARLMGVECDPFTVDAARHLLGVVHHRVEHQRSTPWQDIPELYARLSDEGSSASCIRWAILTLVRSHGCRGARFDEIKGDVWTVPAERVKGSVSTVRDFRVPLSQPALEIARRAAEYSGEFLFPSYRKGHITDQALTKMLRRMGETGTVHGFRTSFRTWVQDTDACGFEVAETVLGHSIGGKVERSYARSDLLDRRRIVMEKWAAFVTKAPAEVVSLRV